MAYSTAWHHILFHDGVFDNALLSSTPGCTARQSMASTSRGRQYVKKLTGASSHGATSLARQCGILGSDIRPSISAYDRRPCATA